MSYHNEYHQKAWANDSEHVIRHSEYFEESIDEEIWNEALELYHQWCEEHNEKPEIEKETALEGVSDVELNHVIYHALELGFEI